ncbi:MAG: sulfatase [Rhodothermales bacterium]
MRQRPLFLLVACFFLSISCTPNGGTDLSTEPPNVLFIAIDDLNDWIGPLKGHPQVQTPHLDALAARGTLFSNAHAQSPICSPSRTSLLTGKRPSSTGIYGLAPWFRDVEELKDIVSLPQHFSQNGYTTYSGGKIYHGGYGRKEEDREFDALGPASTVGPRPEEKIIGWTPGGNHDLMDWGTFPHNDEDKGDWLVASWAVDLLKDKLRQTPTAEPNAPFFLSAGFFLPHVPLYATQKWFDMYPDETLLLPPILENDRDDTPRFSWYDHWDLPEPRLKWLEDEGQLRPLVRAYLASISFVDSQVGRILDALEESGLADNTIVVLWSDHGYHLGEKAISGKNTLWDRSTRVPLIFSGPGVAENAVVDAPVELLDIYPTLLELSRLSPREGLEGHSLMPQLQQADAERAWPAITTHNHDNHGIRTKDWRFIQYADGSQELYNMQEDPNEWTNLASDPAYADIIAEHALWLPDINRKPVPGSRHRILTYENGEATWQGQPIAPDDPIPGLE